MEYKRLKKIDLCIYIIYTDDVCVCLVRESCRERKFFSH